MVVETAAFLQDARNLRMSEAERAAIIASIAATLGAGDVVEGTGGARKVRFGGKGRGKSAVTA